MKNKIVLLILAVALCATPAFPQAKNVILFIGDGAGISSLRPSSLLRLLKGVW
jgi:alkaline phosphatase